MKKMFLILITVLFIAGCGKSEKEINEGNKETEKPKVEEKLKVVDLDSDSRMYAVMINNNSAARPHAGLKESIINYEIVTEGGITRILAIYKDKLPEKIGSIRSSRPYFLDYAMENDAIYVHWGGSTRAYSDISSLGINNIDGMKTKYFYRDKTLNRAYEHTGFSKGSLLTEGASKLGYRTTSDKELLLNYSVKSVNLKDMEEAQIATNIDIKYSSYQTTSYEYDSENKVYLRFMNDKKHIDLDTKEQYSTKNIITYQVKNSSYDSYGRQELDNIGSGEGYFISEGYAVPITWEKTCRSCQTVYKYKDGKEILVNDGNTWIHIQPVGKSLKISSNIK